MNCEGNMLFSLSKAYTPTLEISSRCYTITVIEQLGQGWCQGRFLASTRNGPAGKAIGREWKMGRWKESVADGAAIHQCIKLVAKSGFGVFEKREWL
eukprot:scaffold2903_cov170-Amphora_coffeaeformis.AAC.11